MVQQKAEALKSDMKKNANNVFDGEQNEEARTRQRLESLKSMQEERDKERKQREELYQKKCNEREKVRKNIRDKYKLKGSQLYDGQYDNYSNKADIELARNAEKMKAKKEESCCIQ